MGMLDIQRCQGSGRSSDVVAAFSEILSVKPHYDYADG